mgnify:CR=1 FL=1
MDLALGNVAGVGVGEGVGVGDAVGSGDAETLGDGDAVDDVSVADGDGAASAEYVAGASVLIAVRVRAASTQAPRAAAKSGQRRLSSEGGTAGVAYIWVGHSALLGRRGGRWRPGSASTLRHGIFQSCDDGFLLGRRDRPVGDQCVE